MGSARIDEQIREYYKRVQLSEDARTRLVGVLLGDRPKFESPRRSITMAIAAAAVAVIALFGLFFALFRRVPPQTPQQIAAVVAQHAALGHNERQELEFRVSRTSELRQAMKSLDFTPVEPEMMAGMNMRIVGARYTTIEGVMAAQIVYLDPKGEPCTLYELRPVAKLATVTDGEHEIDGVRVSVWREKGLLMVLARPIA